MKEILIFEDEGFTKLLPLVYTRPVYELICGTSTLREKIVSFFPRAKVSLHCRKYLSPVFKNSFPRISLHQDKEEGCLFVNGRVLFEGNLSSFFSKYKDREVALVKGKELAAIKLKGEKLKKVRMILKREPMRLSPVLNKFSQEVARVKLTKEAILIRYLWDLVNLNPYWIEKEAKRRFQLGKCLSPIPEGSYLVNKKNIFIDRGVKISPGVVIDADKGPVIIEREAKILPQAAVIGPAFIGAGTILKIGAKIYPGTTLGKVCKIGGEVEESIFHDFTNKQHDGFIGHSYLGSWINLGAGTTNSDLKNNYSSVKVVIEKKLLDSGLTFVGLFMADHSKTAINTLFNTGTVVGVSSNLFDSGFLPKYIPSFSWGGRGSAIYKLDKSLQTIRKVMARRKKKLSGEEKQMIIEIFNLTKSERVKR